MRTRILVIGSANMDFVLSTDRFPMLGETHITSEKYSLAPGGKGGNIAVACARLGADCVFCTRLGKDLHGKALYDFYKKEGIDTRLVRLDAGFQTGVSFGISENLSDIKTLVYPGANKNISEEDIEEAVITYPGALIMQFETDYERICEAVGFCNERKIPVVLDADSIKADTDLTKLGELLIFSADEKETEMLTGIRPYAFESCISASIALRKKINTKYIVLKLGANGCFVYDGIYANFVEAYKVRASKSATVGGPFVAALTLEYLRNGKNILDAAKYAGAACAMIVSKNSPAHKYPVDEAVREFMASHSEFDI